MRCRYLREYGLSGGGAVAATLLCGFAFVLGIAATARLALALRPDGLADVLDVPEPFWRTGGIVLLLVLAGYLLWAHLRRHELRIRHWIVPAPSLRLSLAQLGLGIVDVAVVAGVVYVLLPETVDIGYPRFVGIYVLALVVAAASHVPGGVGLFEAALIVLLSGAAADDALLAALIAFRAAYYLLPLAVMALVAGAYELAGQLHGRAARRPAARR